MTDKFEIGEVAVIVRPGHCNNGREVEIVSNEYPHQSDGELGYNVLIAGDQSGYAGNDAPHGAWFYGTSYLRKKKPPQREIDQIVSWDYPNGWKPEKVRV